jgi:hypothetical protein
MKSVMNYSNVLILIALMPLFALGQNSQTGKLSYSNERSNKDNLLKIDSFSSIPSEIDGCSCYFSNNEKEYKNKAYIYVNDFANISFMKINGIMTRFIQFDFKKKKDNTTIAKYKSDQYQMEVYVKKIKPIGEEVSLMIGTIKLTGKFGETIAINFYGECGC